MPNRSANHASGFINPADGLSFSGAAVVVQQSTSLKQTLETANFKALETANFTGPDNIQVPDRTGDNSPFSAGLAASPTPPPESVTSSLLQATPSSDGDKDDEEKKEGETTAASYAGCETSVSNIYCVYTVQEGDTLGAIADRFGLTSGENFVNWELLVYSNNSVVVDPDAVSPGLKMIIPRGNGVLHTVLTSQTLTEIAEQYGVTVESIMAVPGNGISDPNAVSIGSEMLILNPTSFAPNYIPDEFVGGSSNDDEGDVDSSSDDSSSSSSEDDSSSDDSSSAPAITGGGATSGAGFAWPISGNISSYYGPSHPLGIDIDLFGRSGDAISAAMGGVVTFAGGNACCSYGYYVVIDHGNGYQTLYAHLSSISVSVGEVVAQGQYLGGAGTTGYSTGVHLHFELTQGGSRVNPLNYLP